MIIACKVLTWDKEKEEKLGTDGITDTWARISIDSTKIVAVREAVQDQQVMQDQCVIYLDYTTFTIDIPYEDLLIIIGWKHSSSIL